MRVEALNYNMQIPGKNAVHTADKDFLHVLQSTYNAGLDKQLEEKAQPSYCRVQCGVYKRDTIDVSKCSETEIDTGRYKIQKKDGNVRILDKETQENFSWILRYGTEVQVDERSGQKFLINDFGNGFFMMQCVDGELEDGLKEFFGVEELPEKELDGFTVQTDKATGVQYITADGYEWQGGHIIFTDGARMKLNALAETYIREYSGILKSNDEALLYASFEIRGLAKRVPDGILMLGKDNVPLKGKDGKDTAKQRFSQVEMLFAECTIAVYPSGEKDIPDDVYYTFYTPDGIYCQKQGKSELEWQIQLKDKSQYEKVMSYLKDLDSQNNLRFACHENFWRDFLSGQIDMDKFNNFLDTRVVDGVPNYLNVYESGVNIDAESAQYAKYMNLPDFVKNMCYTSEEAFETFFRHRNVNEKKQPIHEVMDRKHLEQCYARHLNGAGRKNHYYNGRWYSIVELAAIWNKELAELFD